MARILVVEDDDNVRLFVVMALRHGGYEVVEASDGGLAAEILIEEEGKFELLLSDVKMPVMDGIALALETGSRYPDLPILLMTGFADQRERAHGMEQLIYDVIAKPFAMADLLQKVDDALNDRPVEIVTLSRQMINRTG